MHRYKCHIIQEKVTNTLLLLTSQLTILEKYSFMPRDFYINYYCSLIAHAID
jgi:hypothetical protein